MDDIPEIRCRGAKLGSREATKGQQELLTFSEKQIRTDNTKQLTDEQIPCRRFAVAFLKL